jgi:hypothetical protein
MAAVATTYIGTSRIFLCISDMLEIAVSPDANRPEGVLVELGRDPSGVKFPFERTCGDDHIAPGGVTGIGDHVYRYWLPSRQNTAITANGGTVRLTGSVRSGRDPVGDTMGCAQCGQDRERPQDILTGRRSK